MTTDSIRQQYRKIIALLDRKELASALSQLDTFLQGINDWPLHEELDEIKTSYEYMLAYLKNGSEDPQRHSLHKQLLARAYRMSDRIRLLHFRQTETTGGIKAEDFFFSVNGVEMADDILSRQ